MSTDVDSFKAAAAREMYEAAQLTGASAELKRSLSAAYMTLANYQAVLDDWKEDPLD
jgi:hypothetical protein